MQTTDTTATPVVTGERRILGLLATAITGVYFTGGIATAMLDTLVPKFKALFALSYTEAMLTQFCFFIAFLLCSAPAGWLGSRIGPVRGTAVGIAVMAAGCLLFAPAARFASYPAFLAALFVLSAGNNLFQICANPLIASLGAPAGAHSRLTLGLAFNALGYALGPLVGATFILAASSLSGHGLDHAGPAALRAHQLAEGAIIQRPFLALALGLALLAAGFRCLSRHTRFERRPVSPGARTARSIWGQPRLAFGALAMFLYVGAEVSLGSILISYLGLPKTLSLGMVGAGRLVSLYWLGAMIGRFAGAASLRIWNPGLVLFAHAIGAMLLVTGSLLGVGWFSAGALIAVGLANSIMFPAIFTLSIEGLGADSPRGSALICMAIVGGAIVPLLCGALADAVGLAWAPIIPAACYCGIAVFALAIARGALAPNPDSDAAFA